MASFHVVTKDRVIHKMDGKCNYVDYSDPNYFKCFYEDHDCWGNVKTRQLLRLFPHSEIKRVINVV